jgi:hypothetical protein
MNSDQVLLQILKRLEAADTDSLLFRADEICEWPDELFASLVDSGLIKPASPVKITGCTGCEENCLMPVNVLPAVGNRPVRFFIACDKLEDVGRIPVDPSQLQQFQIDVMQFARILARVFESDENVDEVRPDRVYHVASTVLGKNRRALFLFLGARWPDANDLLGGLSKEFGKYPAPLILVPYDLPALEERKQYEFISLAHITSFSVDGLTLDLDELILQLFRQPHAMETPTAQNVFKKEGQMWTLSYDGILKYLKHAKGLIYISYLLGSPHREYHVTELVKAAEDPEREFLYFSSGKISTKETIDNYRNRLKEINSELKISEDSGDHLLERELKIEKEALEEQLLKAVGIGGRLRKHPDEIRRHANAVSEAISRSMNTISKINPALWKHLLNTVNRGEFLSYTPEKHTSWII